MSHQTKAQAAFNITCITLFALASLGFVGGIAYAGVMAAWNTGILYHIIGTVATILTLYGGIYVYLHFYPGDHMDDNASEDVEFDEFDGWA